MLVDLLGERKNKPLFKYVVQKHGRQGAVALFEETMAIEAAGGMLTSDGSRRRTPAGVFLALAKKGLPAKQRYLFHTHPERLPTRPMKWEDRLTAIADTLEQQGEATTVKITLVGRPANVVVNKATVVTSMRQSKTPSLPKGLPVPPPDPTVYTVYMNAKQWRKVETALKEPTDVLIVEGYPRLDPDAEAIVVFALNVTTKALQAAQRKPAPAAAESA